MGVRKPRTHMKHGVISTPPNPYRRGGPYDGQFSFRRDGEEFPDFDLFLIGGVHLHFEGTTKSEDQPRSTTKQESETVGQ